jgi:hypothetical protein
MAWVIRRRESIMLDNYHHSWKSGCGARTTNGFNGSTNSHSSTCVCGVK